MAIALAQTPVSNYPGSVSTNTLTFGSATTTGNIIVVVVASGAPSGTLATHNTPTDNKGNTYTAGPTLANSVPGSRLSIFYCENATGGAGHQVTATLSAANDMSMHILEISGAATSSSVDGSNTANTTAANLTTGSITTTNANDILIAAFTDHYNGWSSSSTDSGWVKSSAEETASSVVFTQVVSATNTYTGTTTVGNNFTDNHPGAIIAFKAAGATDGGHADACWFTF